MKISILFCAILIILFADGCNKPSGSPGECVNSFITALEQHDMGKAWGMLGKNAKTHYNSLGEKQRRSGKGAFENEVNRIKSFKKSTEDYSVKYEPAHGDKVMINLIGGEEIFVETINEDGEYKIKDANTIKSLISAIAVEIEEDKGY